MVKNMSAFIRILKHLSMTPLHLRRVFPESALQAITAAVKAGESQHGGEIRVAIELDLPLRQLLAKQTSRQRAVEVFGQLGVWDTDARNGVLLYLCLADRSIEIVADRGYHDRVSAADWARICHDMEVQLRNGDATLALCGAITAISQLVAPLFPRVDRNELPDRPVLL
jgi:uncharacterized membrane protein